MLKKLSLKKLTQNQLRKNNNVLNVIVTKKARKGFFVLGYSKTNCSYKASPLDPF